MILALFIGIVSLLGAPYAAWAIRNNHREQARIKAWEARTKTAWLREGYTKKGGSNGPPQFDARPPAPASQYAKSTALDDPKGRIVE